MTNCIICNSIVLENKCSSCFHIHNEIPEFYKNFSLFVIINYCINCINCDYKNDLKILDLNENFDTSLLLSFNKLKLGIKTVVCNEENIDKLKDNFDIIIVRDIFSTTNLPNYLLKVVKTLMDKDGVLFIMNKEDIYKSKNYFNTNAMNKLCNLNGVFLNFVYKNIYKDINVYLIQNRVCTYSNTIETIMIEMDEGIYD